MHYLPPNICDQSALRRESRVHKKAPGCHFVAHRCPTPAAPPLEFPVAPAPAPLLLLLLPPLSALHSFFPFRLN